MTNPNLSELILRDYQRRLTTDAAQRRLVALATCCRPSRVVAAVHALRLRLTAGRRDAVCCA